MRTKTFSAFLRIRIVLYINNVHSYQKIFLQRIYELYHTKINEYNNVNQFTSTVKEKLSINK